MINQDFKCPVCKYGIDPTCGVHGTKAMTAPNTPTPELVERLLAGISSYGDDGIVGTRAGLIREVAAIVTKQNDVIIDNISAIDEAKALISSQAAAIAKLTAERYVLQQRIKGTQSVLNVTQNDRYVLRQRAEAAEKRVKELEVEAKSYAALCVENDTLRDDIALYRRLKDDADRANKLLSERVAVKDAALMIAYRYMCKAANTGTPVPQEDFVIVDEALRAARSAREA